MSDEYTPADPQRLSAEHCYSLVQTRIGLRIGAPLPQGVDLTRDERFNMSTGGADPSLRFVSALEAYEYVARTFPKWPRGLVGRVVAVAHGVSSGEVEPDQAAGLLAAIQAEADQKE